MDVPDWGAAPVTSGGYKAKAWEQFAPGTEPKAGTSGKVKEASMRNPDEQRGSRKRGSKGHRGGKNQNERIAATNPAQKAKQFRPKKPKPAAAALDAAAGDETMGAVAEKAAEAEAGAEGGKRKISRSAAKRKRRRMALEAAGIVVGGGKSAGGKGAATAGATRSPAGSGSVCALKGGRALAAAAVASIVQRSEGAEAEPSDEEIDDDAVVFKSPGVQSQWTMGSPAIGMAPAAAAAAAAPDAAEAKSGARKLHEKSWKKLSGARFRFINEQLYTIGGEEAYSTFQADPSLFDAYHEGFREQVTGWPTNPVDVFIETLSSAPPSWVVGDFGCGDATLAQSARVRCKVHSFDLVARNELVTACDTASVPLPDAACSACVFSLALMNTNYVDSLIEGHRVLKVGGMMLVAEVKSRVTDEAKFEGVFKRLGFEMLKKNNSNKMFVIYVWKKTAKKPKVKKARAEAPELKPCIYKRR